jgi:hypothetical protein
VWLKVGVSCSLDFQVALTEGISFLGNELHGKAIPQGPENDLSPTTGSIATRHVARCRWISVPSRSAELARPNFS